MAVRVYQGYEGKTVGVVLFLINWFACYTNFHFLFECLSDVARIIASYSFFIRRKGEAKETSLLEGNSL